MAAAAYRAGAQIKDERSGRIHRYHKRTGVADTFILAPSESPKKFQDRAVLWNAAEAIQRHYRLIFIFHNQAKIIHPLFCNLHCHGVLTVKIRPHWPAKKMNALNADFFIL